MTDTRERLTVAALESVSERGLAGATSRDIARRAGTNLQAITYHFGSKDELVAQALLSAFRSWVEPAVEALRAPGDPIVRMVSAVQALQGSFERSRALLPAYLEALVQANRTSVLQDGVREALAELRGFLRDQISELRASGFLPAWIDADGMATLLLATADGLALHAALDPANVDHHAASAQAMQLMLAAANTGGREPAVRADRGADAPATGDGTGPAPRSGHRPRRS